MGSRYALDWRRQRSNKSGMREYSSRIDEKLSRYYDEFSDNSKYEEGKQSRRMESNRRKRHQRSQEHKKAKRRKLGSQDILDKRTSDRSRTCPDRMNGNRSSNNRIDYEDEKRMRKKNPRVFKTSLGDGERVRFDVLVGRKGMPEAANVTGPNGGYVMGSRYALDWRRQRSNKSGMREYSSRIDEKLSRYYDEFSDNSKYEEGKQSRRMESNRRKRHQRSQEHKKAKRRKLGSQDILDKRTSDRSRTCPDRMNGNRSSNNRIDYEDEKRMRKRARNRRKRHNYTRNVRARKLRVQELERELQGQSSTGDYDKYIRI